VRTLVTPTIEIFRDPFTLKLVFGLKERGKMPSTFTSINRTLFIGDLSYFCREEHIHNLFSQFGPVDCLSIKRGKSTGDCLMHGFIQMSSVQAAEDALKALNGQVFMGRRMR
jgi:RNA recognition motif-containing protein